MPYDMTRAPQDGKKAQKEPYNGSAAKLNIKLACLWSRGVWKCIPAGFGE